MSKRSEEAALRMFPEKLTAGTAGYGYGSYSFTYDMNQQARYGAVKGYEQAEKDIKNRLLELIEEEAKFWDDGEIIFSKLKKELNEL